MEAIGPTELIIIGVVVIIILFMFRKRLRKFIFQIGKDGLRSELHAGDEVASPPAAQPKPGGVNISGNVQTGRGHRIDVGRGDTAVRDNVQTGHKQEIVVRPEGSMSGPDPDLTDEPPLEHTRRTKLRQFLITYFDDGELRDLCFDFGFDYQSLPGEGKRDKAREIVRYFTHRNRLDELEAYCRQQRPDSSW
jgi:hypothetical protein